MTKVFCFISLFSFFSKKAFCFFSPFFQFVPNSLSKKTNLAKGDVWNASDSHKNFCLNRCVMKHYAISNGHIGDGYREIQEIGASEHCSLAIFTDFGRVVRVHNYIPNGTTGPHWWFSDPINMHSKQEAD